MINADAVFGDASRPSGLWQEVGPARARSRGLEPGELQEFYRQRNLLKALVLPEHVGNAVVFFATNQTPTTGATLPVDGGVLEAFPRGRSVLLHHPRPPHLGHAADAGR